MNTLSKALVPALCALLVAACDDKTGSTTATPPATGSVPPASGSGSTPPVPEPPATPSTPEPPAPEPSTPATPPVGGPFSYDPAGQLKLDQGGHVTGQGVADATVWDAAMRFPLRCAPAFANSQVYNPGGMVGGGFCEDANYHYPWQDNFCEKRSNPDQVSWACPAHSAIHQGQDIRAHTKCSNKGTSAANGTFWRDPSYGVYRTKYQIVAVEDAKVTYIGSYSVYLTVMQDGQVLRRYTYLHMNMDDVNSRIAVGQTVAKGQVIGTLSNQFGNNSAGHPIADQTTPHLHFEIQANIVGTDGNSHFTFVSPYTTLVGAYQRLLADGNAGDCPP